MNPAFVPVRLEADRTLRHRPTLAQMFRAEPSDRTLMQVGAKEQRGGMARKGKNTRQQECGNPTVEI